MSDGRKLERPILAVSFRFRGCDFIVKGMDEQHLREVCKAVSNGEVPAIEHTPAVILLETIRNTSEAEGKYIRQIGGSGNYAQVKILLEPNDRGKGFEFINGLQDGIVPREYIAPIEEGVREALQGGVLRGYEVVDVTVTLIDGSHHHTDSNAMAFRIAASQAFLEAARKAGPMLLEPVMKLEAMVSEAYAGAVIADINARRGRIESIEPHAGFLEITALAPLSEMLRSSKHGQTEYPMQFAGYEEARYPRDEFGDYDTGVTANKPIRPRAGSGYTAAKLDGAFESS